MFSLILWVFILILGLSFFGISLQAIISSPAGQANFAYLFHLLSIGWDWILVVIKQFKV
ncbi:MAG: hypothetical protein JWN18_583 [Parcubacteria group bacterium]|nr:hypothetical protein [Parcubacteria group bacterium]